MKKRIAVFGASGTVGSAVVTALKCDNDIIPVGRSTSGVRADVTDETSIRSAFQAIGTVDAIISTVGQLHFGPLTKMTSEQFLIGLKNKLLGQVTIALIGQHFLAKGGSITLTSGIVAESPIRYGSNATAVNAAIEGFVRAAACELDQQQRINAVSPTMLTESLEVFGSYFPGFEPASGARVAQAYVRSVLGVQTGQVFNVW